MLRSMLILKAEVTIDYTFKMVTKVIIVKKNKIFIVIVIVIILIISALGSKGELVENRDIIVGIGYDIQSHSKDITYNLYGLTYTFEGDNKVKSEVVPTTGNTLGDNREARQLNSGKTFLLGMARVIVVNETGARFGLKNFIDSWINNPDINDRSVCVICKGSSQDILKYNVEGFPSSAEYIEGLIKNGTQFNFFSTQNSIIDVIVRMDAEGRTTLLPYVDITNEGIKITGLAIFHKDKMVGKADIQETKIINLLKENNVKGILTIEKSPKNYINLYATSKRKISCDKQGNKYKFTINLTLNGSVISNELYKHMTENTEDISEFEEDMANHVEKICKDAIYIMQNDYKVDVLDLGRIAAAKYGRGSGIDWDEVVSKSDIEVNVKVKVDTEGRGNY